MRLRILLLLHARLAAYKYTALIPCVVVYSCILQCHPYILQHFNGNVFALFVRINAGNSLA